MKTLNETTVILTPISFQNIPTVTDVRTWYFPFVPIFVSGWYLRYFSKNSLQEDYLIFIIR